MITSTFIKAMKVGDAVKKLHLDTKYKDWSYSTEYASLVDICDAEADPANVKLAAELIEKTRNYCEDHGYSDASRGVVAGMCFGGKLELVKEAEQIWEDDVIGRFNSYMEVCKSIVH